MLCGYQHYFMAVKYIKKAAKTPETDDHKTQAAVQDILNDIAKRRT